MSVKRLEATVQFCEPESKATPVAPTTYTPDAKRRSYRGRGCVAEKAALSVELDNDAFSLHSQHIYIHQTKFVGTHRAVPATT